MIKEFLKVTEPFEFMSAKFDDLEKEIKKKDEKINQVRKKTIENLVENRKAFCLTWTIWSTTHGEIVWFYMVSMKATTITPLKFL